MKLKKIIIQKYDKNLGIFKKPCGLSFHIYTKLLPEKSGFSWCFINFLTLTSKFHSSKEVYLSLDLPLSTLQRKEIVWKTLDLFFCLVFYITKLFKTYSKAYYFSDFSDKLEIGSQNEEEVAYLCFRNFYIFFIYLITYKSLEYKP